MLGGRVCASRVSRREARYPLVRVGDCERRCGVGSNSFREGARALRGFPETPSRALVSRASPSRSTRPARARRRGSRDHDSNLALRARIARTRVRTRRAPACKRASGTVLFRFHGFREQRHRRKREEETRTPRPGGWSARRARRPTPTDARFPDVFTLSDDRLFFRSTRSRRSSPSLAPEQAGLARAFRRPTDRGTPQRWHPKRTPERAHNFFVARARQPLCSPWRIPGRRRRRPWTCRRRRPGPGPRPRGGRRA